jgi:hypothetical protein
MNKISVKTNCISQEAKCAVPKILCLYLGWVQKRQLTACSSRGPNSEGALGHWGQRLEPVPGDVKPRAYWEYDMFHRLLVRIQPTLHVVYLSRNLVDRNEGEKWKVKQKEWGEGTVLRRKT